MKIVIALMLVAVLAALASAGVFMLRKGGRNDDPKGKRMARALALRVGLSVALFVFILISWYLGWVRPGGLPIGR